MKNVLFDLAATQPISGNKYHGGSEYAKTLFLKLCGTLFSFNVNLEIFYDPQRDIEKSILMLCKTNKIVINTCSDNDEISKLLYEKHFNIFYSALPYKYIDISIPEKTKFIYTIHGLRELEYPVDHYEAKYKKNGLKSLIKQCISFLFLSRLKQYKVRRTINDFEKLFSITKNQNIITISRHSKYAIDYFFPKIIKSNVDVFYSPAKISCLNEDNASNVFKSLSVEPGKYILLIGGNRFIKGAWRACKILYHVLHNYDQIPSDIKVLVLGVSHKKAYQKITKNNCRFVFEDYVSSEDLEIIYKNAFLFLYPTLNEGFGYPPLEAMKYGIPCACSANSAITEICGDAVLYFNPLDAIEMSIRILQSFDKNIRQEIQQKGVLRFKYVYEKQKQDLNLLIRKIACI